MKAGWQKRAISDLCEVINGGTPKTGIPAYWDGPHQWVTPAEMGKRSTPYIGQTQRSITDEGLQNSSASPLPPYSVILSSRAPIGHLVINTVPMATNQGCKGLVPSGVLDHKFLFYYLSSIVDLLNDLGTGATFKELSGGKLKEVQVPYPPLPEQQRIVTILDEAFEGIATAKANAEKNLQNAREVFDNYLESVFSFDAPGMSKRPLGGLATFRNGINYTKQSRGESVRIIGVKDFQKNFWAPMDDLDSVTLDGSLPAIDAVKPGDILSVRSNGNPLLIGRCLLVPEHEGSVSHSGFTIRVRLTTDAALPHYLCHFLKSKTARRELIAGGNGANIKSLNQGTLAAIQVPVPSISKQQAVVQSVEAMTEELARLDEIYCQKLSSLDELKLSLLHRAFNGDL